MDKQTVARTAAYPPYRKKTGRASEREALVISMQDMTNRFRTGQSVRLRSSIRTRSAAGGDYTVVRELPETGGETQYRIKSGREAHERVVNESDLEPG